MSTNNEEQSIVENAFIGVVILLFLIGYGIVWVYEWVVLHLHMMWHWIELFFSQ